MIFNSLEYLLFLPLVFLIYWLGLNGRLKAQNGFLLIMSYLFYGMWNWKFLFLLMFSTVLDFYSGLKISQTENKVKRKTWLVLSVSINLGLLCFFKYYNFFIEEINSLIDNGNSQSSLIVLNLVLPIGISFYTFHGLSYIFDIYNYKVEARKDFINYALFVSFFPLLVAGPIERATHLLPQIEVKRNFSESKSIDGLKQILWGLFKKIVIADNCAIYSNIIFNDPDMYSGSTLIVGAVFFAFQIYGDFSGYSDIALGSARILGFELLKNFSYPYFSRSLTEFWKRWHISLSSWFRDYLYIPLGGNRTVEYRKIINVLIVFIVSGFWHGANWTFIVWGLINAVFVLLDSYFFKIKTPGVVAEGKWLPNFKEFSLVIINFSLISLIWVFFRADSISNAFHYISQIFSRSILNPPEVAPKLVFFLLILFMLVEWMGRMDDYAIKNIRLFKWRSIRWSLYTIIVVFILIFGATPQTFIYFQF
jgi:alginate O-acetyltransferase complex protein AlgI